MSEDDAIAEHICRHINERYDRNRRVDLHDIRIDALEVNICHGDVFCCRLKSRGANDTVIYLSASASARILKVWRERDERKREADSKLHAASEQKNKVSVAHYLSNLITPKDQYNG